MDFDLYFSEVIEELKSIWHKIFTLDTQELHYGFTGKKTKLSLIMFYYYTYEGNDKVSPFKKLIRNIIAISNNPNMSIRENESYLRIDEIKDIKPYQSEILNQKESDRKILTLEKKLSTFTNENIFIAVFLEKIVWDLKRLKSVLEKLISDFEQEKENSNKEEKLEKCENYLEIFNECVQKIDYYLPRFTSLRFLPFLSSIPFGFPFPVFSEKIYKNRLYRDIWNFYREYSRFLIPDDKEIDLCLIADWRIYELWVLFKIKNGIRKIFNEEPEVEMKEIEEEVIIDTKKELKDVFDKNFLTYIWNNFILEYQYPIGNKNEIYRTISTPIRPDIIFYNEKNKDKLILFDAKYNKLFSELEKKSGDDFHSAYVQMHMYRDNIRIDRIKKPVQLGMIFFPGEIDSGSNTHLSKLLLTDFEKAWEEGITIYNLKDKKDIVKLEEILKLIIKKLKNGGQNG
uniref:DUF2357 domain-containing protein n=1 Tax=candidate division WOR-3 bacterium TaxID=2052148 RepID=A0A7C4YG01_UNCW3